MSVSEWLAIICWVFFLRHVYKKMRGSPEDVGSVTDYDNEALEADDDEAY